MAYLPLSTFSLYVLVHARFVHAPVSEGRGGWRKGRRKRGKEKIMGVIGLYFNLHFLYFTQSSLNWFSLMAPPNNKAQGLACWSSEAFLP